MFISQLEEERLHSIQDKGSDCEGNLKKAYSHVNTLIYLPEAANEHLTLHVSNLCIKEEPAVGGLMEQTHAWI